MSTLRVVIEVEDDQSEEQVLRMLRDANRRQAAETANHWIDLETPFFCLNVTRIVGTVEDTETDKSDPGRESVMVPVARVRPL